jgi:hypothetical protein
MEGRCGRWGIDAKRKLGARRRATPSRRHRA